MKPQELSFDCELFDEFKERMDLAIIQTIRHMMEKEIHSGRIVGKMKITLEKGTNEDGEVFYMPIVEPEVELKLEAKAKIDCGTQKCLMKQNGDGFVVGTNQISIDELIKEGA